MELLRARQDQGLFTCVGLDSDTTNPKFPQHLLKGLWGMAIRTFNDAIIDKIAGVVACIKINTAFYEMMGPDGIEQLRLTVRYLHHRYPNIPVIIDAKRGDIGNTNEGYAKFVFDYLGGDAITVPPYMGKISLLPFLQRTDKGTFVLVRTSNPGAGEFQDLPVETDWAPDGTVPLYQYVAFKVSKDWNENGNVGVVAGATGPDELAKIRQIVGTDMQILIPGVGAQGGDLEKSVAAASQDGSRRFIVNLSRSVIFASSGEDFAKAAYEEVVRNNAIIQSALAA